MGWAGAAADAWVLCQPWPAGPFSWPKGGSSRELWLLPPRRLRLPCGGRTELGSQDPSGAEGPGGLRTGNPI